MRTQVAVEIDACPEHVWAVLTDVTRWPEWTAAVREVRLLDGRVLGQGSVVRVRAAGLPERTWRVTGFTRQRSFTWSADGLGVRARVVFRLARPAAAHSGGDPDPARTRLVVDDERTGPVAGVVAWATRRATERDLRDLVEGLRRRCEQRRPLASSP